MMTMKVQTRGEIIITSEGLIQIVRAHFDRISPAEWAMLANGTCDIETTNILLSMFVQLIQTLSANVLRIVIPRDEVRVRCLNDAESNRAFQTITTVLQDSVGLIFGQALNVPSTQAVDQSIDSQELTTLIECEVSQNVNKILSKGSHESLDMELRVASRTQSVHTSRSMLSRAKSCLQLCLRALQCSCAKPLARTRSVDSVFESKKGPCYSCFSLFARKNFKKMQRSIGDQIQMEDAYASAQSLSGSVSPVLPSPPRSSPSPRTPEKEYDEIRRDVEEIFQQMNMAPGPESGTSQSVNDYLQREDAKRFFEKLVNMMYCHFHVSDVHTKQASLTGKALSESQLSCRPGQEDEPFLMLHSYVEVQVSKFTKDLYKFMQQDPLDYLNNYDLFEACMEQEQESFNSRRYDIFERSMVHPKACVPSFISADVPAIVLHSPPQKERTEPSPKTFSPQASQKHPKARVPSFISADVPAIVLNTPPQKERTAPSTKTVSPQTSQKSLTESQFMTQTVVFDLTREIFKKLLVRQRQNYQTFADRLSQKAQERIDLQDWECRKVGKSLNKIVKGVKRSLDKEYGSSKRLCEALLTDTDAFEATVMKLLQIHIDLELNRKPSLWSRICKCFCC